MTNELAIRILTGDVLGTTEQTQKAVTMAVRALSQPDVPDMNVGDLISRQDVVECVYKALRTPPLKGVLTDTMSLAIGMVNDLPLAQPERKKGKWIDDRGLYMCSSCGKLWTHWWARVVPLNQMCKELRYCPMCGADMRGDGNDN